jgi:hypothetical protein
LYEEHRQPGIVKHVLIFASKLAKTVVTGENISTILLRKYENKKNMSAGVL